MNKMQGNIGENAGIVWRALNGHHLTWDELLAATNLAPIDLAAAIGWLAREQKINIQATGFDIFQERYY